LIKFDSDGRYGSMFLNNPSHVQQFVSPTLDNQLHQLSSLIRDNTELLQHIKDQTLLYKPSPSASVGNQKPDPAQKLVHSNLSESNHPINREENIKVLMSTNKRHGVSLLKKKPVKREKSISVTEVHKSGPLFVKKKPSGWMKVHVVLTTTQISLFDTQNTDVRLGHIRMANCTVKQGSHKYSLILEGQEKIQLVDPHSMIDSSSELVFRSREENEILSWFGDVEKCIRLTKLLLRDDFFSDDEQTDELQVDDPSEELSDFDEFSLEDEEPVNPPPPSFQDSVNQMLQAASNPKERSALQKMIGLLGSQLNPSIHDGPLLLRFLRARQLDPTKATEMIKARFEWETQFNPKEITLDQIHSEVVKKKGYFHCRDKENRPCFVALVGRHNPKDSDVQVMLKMLVFVLEKAAELAPPGVEKFCTIFDCSGFGINQMDWPFVKDAIQILQNFYPERLGALYVVNYPMIINMLWKMIKPWLDNRTSEKIQFVDNKTVRKYFDPERLPKRFGGLSKYEEQDFELGLETLEPLFVPPQ